LTAGEALKGGRRGLLEPAAVTGYFPAAMIPSGIITVKANSGYTGA
jgi:hypothetical protein